MKYFVIKNIGKIMFWNSFALGNICLFGYLFTKNEDYAFAGFLLLIFAGIVNAIVLLGLFTYSIFYTDYYEECYQSMFMILLNIPIAILYAAIGLSIQ